MARQYNVAVVGATGMVGREIIKVLEQRKFPVQKLKFLASERSVGKKLSFRDEEIPVEILGRNSFKGIDIALSSPGSSVSKEFTPYAVKAGAVVIDNTSAFRMQEDVPLVVPEVNPARIKDNKGIIANPNCSTIQMVVALKPIYDAVGIKRIVVSTYQAVSGAGKRAVDTLEKEAEAILGGRNAPEGFFPYQIALNVIPHIDVFLDNYYTKEEMKMVMETRKIMELPELQITATCARVPVFRGHSESVNIETSENITREKAVELLRTAPGIKLIDNPAGNKYPMPVMCLGRDEVFVGRIRKDESIPNGLNLWVVSDNLRKGAALNAVQIAELL